MSLMTNMQTTLSASSHASATRQLISDGWKAAYGLCDKTKDCILNMVPMPIFHCVAKGLISMPMR